VIAAIVSSGCPFNSRTQPSTPRPPPIVFTLPSPAATHRQLLLRQVPSKIRQHFDVGFQLWPSAVLLSRWFAAHRGQGAYTRRTLLADKRILELGAGVGLVGLSLATCARSDPAMRHTPPSEVVLTDFNPSVLENLRYNVRLNSSSSDGGGGGEEEEEEEEEEAEEENARNTAKIRVEQLDFGAVAGNGTMRLRQSARRGSGDDDGGASNSGGSRGNRGNGWTELPFDMVVAADVIASASDAASVATVLRLALARPHGVAYLTESHPSSRVGVDHLAEQLLLPDPTDGWTFDVEIVPYEQPMLQDIFGQAEGGCTLFAGLEAEVAAGMRWEHWRVSWRDPASQPAVPTPRDK